MTYPEQDIPTQIINTEGSFIGQPLSEEERYLKTSRNPKEYTVQGTMRFSRTKSSQAGWGEELETPSILGFRTIPVSGHLSRKIGKATWRGKELKVMTKPQWFSLMSYSRPLSWNLRTRIRGIPV